MHFDIRKQLAYDNVMNQQRDCTGSEILDDPDIVSRTLGVLEDTPLTP